MNENIEIIEIFITVVSSLAIIFGMYSMLVLIRNRRVLIDFNVKDGRIRHSNSDLRNESSRIILQALFLWLGIRGMLNPPPPPTSGSTTIRIAFVIVELLILLCSILDYRMRYRDEKEIQALNQKRTSLG
jgi:hypothetical protein